jgi:hypothetical protein
MKPAARASSWEKRKPPTGGLRMSFMSSRHESTF